MSKCPICGGGRHVELDRRSPIPVLQNRVWPDVESARAAPTGALRMLFCLDCEFAWNADFDAARDIYDPAYDNDQMQSDVFKAHVEAMAARIVAAGAAAPAGTKPSLVEVGCGQGGFLAMLDSGRTFSALVGYDPAWRGGASGSDRVRIVGSYFEGARAGSSEPRADVFVSRHTIEHVPDPIGFLTCIRQSIADHPHARLFLETPDILWILENGQIQDLFYEHCSIFSPRALETALARTGFEPIAVQTVFDGQYLWAEARPGVASVIDAPTEDCAALASKFRDHRAAFVEAWRARLSQAAAHGPVWIWGASSKGVTFTLLVDPEAEHLTGAIDINPKKIGQCLPLSGLRISAPADIEDGATIVLMNPNYEREIRDMLDALGKKADVLTLADL